MKTIVKGTELRILSQILFMTGVIFGKFDFVTIAVSLYLLSLFLDE